ncbi:site-2 protease family protein [candidate division WOR-3 bacterium]|nr:site-2 protease family protein [candidate division WOR-3 bacterium]
MQTFINILIQLLILFFSIIVHEVSHGYAALRYGDPTAKHAGRLSFNPLRHIDPFGTIILPLILILTGSPFLIGWAKPVPINPYYLRNPREDMMKIGAAGPLSNFALAILFSLIYRTVGIEPFAYFILYAVFINLLLAVFNLIPVPPLDGSRILGGLLPYDLYEKYMRIEPYGFIIVFAFFFIGFGSILIPLVRFICRLLTGAVI